MMGIVVVLVRALYRVAWLGLPVLVLASAFGALAAANSVAGSGVGDQTLTATADELKPAECAGISLSTVIMGSGTINGAAVASLILASTGVDVVNAGNGNDCILGGAGDDNLKGQGGNDVLMGGPGNDALNGGNGTDICYGGGQAGDTFVNCETIVTSANANAPSGKFHWRPPVPGLP